MEAANEAFEMLYHVFCGLLKIILKFALTHAGDLKGLHSLSVNRLQVYAAVYICTGMLMASDTCVP